MKYQILKSQSKVYNFNYKWKSKKYITVYILTAMVITGVLFCFGRFIIFKGATVASYNNQIAEHSNIWIVGDSTVSYFKPKYYYPRYGWGTQIENYLDGSFTVQNLAVSGTSSKSYTTDSHYQTLLDGMKRGDYLLIGFGHNDEKTDEARYTNPNGNYLEEGSFAKSLYENYIKPAQVVGCQVILCTPIVRRTSTGMWSDTDLHIMPNSGKYVGGDYPQAIRELGKSLNIPVVDMTSLTKYLYDKLGPDETIYLHYWTSYKPESVDATHTNIWGGKYNAYLITKTIKELKISGLSEHVIDAQAPTKEDTLVSNPDYKPAIYNSDLKQSNLWKDYGIWKGTVFGDIGAEINSEDETLEKDNNGNMHISVGARKGRITNDTDGIAMYYYKVPSKSNFKLTAKAKINKLNFKDDMSTFGLMARDEIYIDYNTTDKTGDYVTAAPLKFNDKGGIWNCFARKGGELTQGGICKNSIFEGDTVDLSIESSLDGYACKFGNENTVTAGFDFKLTSIDPNNVFVGMFVSRDADITFSDIKLIIDGVEVTT